MTATEWPGAVSVYASATGADFALLTEVTTPATLGEIVEDVPAGAIGVRDRATTIRVRLTRGTLSSITPEALLAGGNLAAIGDGSPENWELVQFEKADLVGDNTYDLSVLLRGQAGSDALMPALWPAGSLFVLMNGVPKQLELPSSTREISRTYRIGTSGRPFDDPSYDQQVLAFSGVGLRPLSPVHLRAEFAGSDLEVSWTRRTREDGDLWGPGDVPLGEAMERYRVRVMRGGAVLRDTEVTTPDWIYSEADQASDGFTAGDEIRIAQISEKVGPGAEAILTVA